MIDIFKNKRFITRGINENIPPYLQLLLWNLIDEMPVSNKDYLQVFSLFEHNGKLKIIHTQEEPEPEEAEILEEEPKNETKFFDLLADNAGAARRIALKREGKLSVKEYIALADSLNATVSREVER